MLHRLVLLFLCVGLPLRAEVPRVVTDFPPVHSLVAMVMEDIGTPEVLLPPGADPHNYAMRPSEAAALEQADLVVWIGPALTPWLERPIESIASRAEVMALLNLAPVTIATDEDHGHDEHKDHDEHDDHNDHKDHDEHDDHADHDDADAHDDHGPIDPHAWLDPVNAAHWLNDIAAALGRLDPSNAEGYELNADRAVERLQALEAQIADQLAESRGKSYAVEHNAYAYFEARFGLSHRFAITDSHAQEPGPARIAKLQESAREEDISCILTEESEPLDLLKTVIEGHQAKVLTADPKGSNFALGPLLYMDVMSGISLTLADC